MANLYCVEMLVKGRKSDLDEWVGEEAVPVINAYYGIGCKTLQECFDTIPQLEHSDQMLLREIELEVEPFKKL